jgi:mannose-6-phosphate isomerase-like protein (cupin superfamily)
MRTRHINPPVDARPRGPGFIQQSAKAPAHAGSFDSAFESVENDIFKVVFFPDRIYHERYLNATRSARYRYNVQEVRGYLDITVIKATVYLDGLLLGNVLRLEYGASRLVEQARESRRFIKDRVVAWMNPLWPNGTNSLSASVVMNYDAWTDTFQVELWETLDTPAGMSHAYSVLDQMGSNGSITRVAEFAGVMAELDALKQIQLAFREYDVDLPSGFPIQDYAWDNAFLRSHQEPRTSDPSSPSNTISDNNYLLDFQRGWYLHVPDITPVRYRNAMMDATGNPNARPDNIIDMRWIVQRELGGSMIFFHHVTIPPGAVEGNHQHIGSEELYYVLEGEGIAYLHVGDDPKTDAKDARGKDVYTIESRVTMGLGPNDFRRLPVKPGSVIFTKSGGMHGIRNTGDKDLKFVAFLYHST